MLKALNYDRKNIFTLNIIAFDGAGRSQVVNVAKFPIVINVADVENNPPRFITDSRISSVPEDAPLVQIQCHVDVNFCHIFIILRALELYKFKLLMETLEFYIRIEFYTN